MSKVRVRFAPSPTGYFHIGGARTALFNWLYARHTGGTFVLRIENTDTERNTQESLDSLLNDLEWLGLNWDEGPGAGGAYGPYYQSERGDIYKEYLQKLQDTGHAYEKEGAIWLKVSGKPQIINDVIHGPVQRVEEKDFVILRSNGNPGFHFVNVVDDIAMHITHVIRGEDHLSNTSKHLEVYQALGATAPKFAHIPLILKTDGPGKMSKRERGSLVEFYRDRYFLPEALLNYLSLLGWSPKNDKEVMSIDEIIKLFDLPAINKTHARFDERKLNYVNAEHLKHLSKEVFYEHSVSVLRAKGFESFLSGEAYLRKVLEIVQEKLRSLEELPNFIAFFFEDTFPYDEKEKSKVLHLLTDAQLLSLKAILEKNDFTQEALESAIKAFCTQENIPVGHAIHSLRFACSGKGVGPGLYALLVVLGKKRVLERIKRFETLRAA